MYKTTDGLEYENIVNELLPVKIFDLVNISEPENLLKVKSTVCSSQLSDCSIFKGKGARIVLDFGKEICGGVRIITRACPEPVRMRLTFGESVSEALSDLGDKNSCNDHSPRDLVISVSTMSDLNYGQTGFRFLKIEALDDKVVYMQTICAVSVMPNFPSRVTLKTNDTLLNKIIDTAIYTAEVNCQRGYIWDGIKRDRLVWCGDLNPEILTLLYSFGDVSNIRNSLDFLYSDKTDSLWINNIPSYSAWWVINFCDYVRLTGNTEYFLSRKNTALEILGQFDSNISKSGDMQFGNKTDLVFFLDWPTYGSEDAVIGTGALICYAAKKFAEYEKSDTCDSLLKKLSIYLEKQAVSKQVRAFQILAGSKRNGDADFLEKNGAEGFSTFMAYYILSADYLAGGKNMLPIIKEYYGGMLSKGATTFWEDFDISWLKLSSSIDRLPKNGEKDIHADFGNYCYKGLRHSLCHGWSSGVAAFIFERVLGLSFDRENNEIIIKPNLMGLKELEATIPFSGETVTISIKGNEIKTDSPNIVIVKSEI